MISGVLKVCKMRLGGCLGFIEVSAFGGRGLYYM